MPIESREITKDGKTIINFGPQHPAAHGVLRMILDLDGETVQNVDVQPGYLHRGFEKSCERGTWAQVFPYADRLNYVSPMLNNVGFSLAVEADSHPIVDSRGDRNFQCNLPGLESVPVA